MSVMRFAARPPERLRLPRQVRAPGEDSKAFIAHRGTAGMGRPYAEEMGRLADTYEWAAGADISGLARFVGRAAGRPMYAVGSGGSLTVATLAAVLHRHSGKTAGKVAKFCDSIADEMKGLIDPGDLRIRVILYVATGRAVDAIRTAAGSLLPSMPITVSAACRIPSAVRLDESADEEFHRLASQKKYGWASAPDRHMKKGKLEKPYPGFDHCALPLILHHNTPNNSLPILYATDGGLDGLFPRITRHRQ